MMCPTLSSQHKKLQFAVDDPRIMLTYDPSGRLFSIPAVNTRQVMTKFGWPKYKGPAYQIYFCPFSGKRLPGEVYTEWHDEIMRIYKIDPMGFGWEDRIPGVPDKYFTEDWWIEKGLPLKPLPESVANSSALPEAVPHRFQVEDLLPGFAYVPSRPPHLCPGLASALGDEAAMFWYLPNTREYGPRILDPDQPVDYQKIEVLPVDFCPWCGAALPLSLRAEWLAALEKEGLSPDDPNLPEPYKSDRWWKPRSL